MNKNNIKKGKNPWSWIPSLYFAEGIPYVVVNTLSVTMYKNFGLSNTEIAFYTGLFYLPWLIKPLWSPFVDILKTKRWWILSMQLLLGAGFGAIALAIPAPFYLQITMVLFFLLAFSSATHDIAADGFYMIGLDDSQQSFFVGIRSTFYRIATILGQGVLVMVAGMLAKMTGDIRLSWSITFFILAGLFIALFVYHRFVLPHAEKRRDASDISALPEYSTQTVTAILADFGKTFATFFQKKGIAVALAFMLFYRLSEAMLVKLSSPFLLDTREVGGLGLETAEVGFVYGVMGIIALTVGGILGGIAVSRKGLKFWIWIMALCITLPHFSYLYLSYFQPTHFVLINIAVAVEQFGYGFGFTAYMLYLIYFSDGEYKTAHYAICTGFMAAGMMLPGMAAGWLQELLGYNHFFVFVLICSIPTLAVIPFLKIDKEFGKKKGVES